MLSVYIRRDFPSLSLYRSYLDTARVGLMPTTVRDDAVRSLLEYMSDPLGKIGDVGWKYEYLRRGLARIFRARGPGNVTLMGSTTSCITRMAASIMVSLSRESGEPIQLAATIYEYPGVIRALESLCSSMRHACAGFTLLGEPGEPEWEEYAVGFFEESPGVLVASSVAWVTGYLADIGRVARAAEKAGGYLIVDSAQQLGQVPIEYERVGVDVVCGTTKKWLLNPLSSMGIAYVSDRIIEGIEPYIIGYHNVETGELDLCDPGGLSGEPKLKADADRFMSISRPSLFSVDVANSVIDYMLNISVHAVRDHILSLVALAEDILEDEGFRVELSGLPYDKRSGIMLVDLGLTPARHYEVCRKLAKRGVAVSCRGQAGFQGVRVSVHLYNDESDIRVFAEEALRVVKELGEN